MKKHLFALTLISASLPAQERPLHGVVQLTRSMVGQGRTEQGLALQVQAGYTGDTRLILRLEQGRLNQEASSGDGRAWHIRNRFTEVMAGGRWLPFGSTGLGFGASLGLVDARYQQESGGLAFTERRRALAGSLDTAWPLASWMEVELRWVGTLLRERRGDPAATGFRHDGLRAALAVRF